MNRWTIKELNETDDITFTMCILSERREMLNQEAPLAKKLKRAYHTLDEVRNGRPITDDRDNIFGSIRERIYCEVERENVKQDAERHLREENHDLQGLTPDDVLADDEIVDEIMRLFVKAELGEDEWYAMQNAIETSIKEILKKRKSQ